jgi:hypothetical protein
VPSRSPRPVYPRPDRIPRTAAESGIDFHASHREPVAIFAGEVIPQYAGDLDDGTVRQLLNELAEEMGRTLEQEEVHIAYGDWTWTLKTE